MAFLPEPPFRESRPCGDDPWREKTQKGPCLQNFENLTVNSPRVTGYRWNIGRHHMMSPSYAAEGPRMFTWIDRRKYRNEVLKLIQEIAFDSSAVFLLQIKTSHPGIDNAIKCGFKDKRSKEDLAVNLAGSILTKRIEEMKDTERRHQLWHDTLAWTQSWSSNPGYAPVPVVVNGLSKVPPNVDAGQWKLKWAIQYVCFLFDEKLIGESVYGWFCSELFGALAGLSKQQREAERLSNIIDKAFDLPVLREGDDGPLLPSDLGSADPPILSGVEIEVRLALTATGIILVREDDGKQVTEQRALTQDDLQKVPLDAAGYAFVNFQPPSGDLCSCLITKPDSHTYGSMRAFWWALARTHVVSTDAKASGTRMTRTAFAQVFGTARGMWDVTIKEAGSIERMRDLIVPLRNVHLNVISELKKDATGEAAKLGFDIALAMVLATQSEDPKLEDFAFQRFKRFLWQPGEEPREFRQGVRE